MKTAKTKTRTAKAKAKTKRKSPASRPRRGRNSANDQALSLDPPAKEIMPEQAKADPPHPVPAPPHPVRASIDRVMAECDKVDALLIGITRPTPGLDLPPLTIKEIDIEDGEGGTRRDWAVVSGNPQKPLTEAQAKEIVEALQSRSAPESPSAPAPTSIAAE